MVSVGLLLSVGGILVGFVTFVHVLLCVFLIGVVLVQSGRAGDLASAFGGGASQANLAAMSSENILTLATKISAFGFMLTSLLLALFAHGKARSVLDVVPDEPPAAVGAAEPGEQPATAPEPGEAAGGAAAGEVPAETGADPDAVESPAVEPDEEEPASEGQEAPPPSDGE